MMGNDGEKELTLCQKLCDIQRRLNAPKGQYNSFGKYKYRNCEDILEAVKPLLHEHGMTLVIRDDIKEIAGRVYVQATACLYGKTMSVAFEITAQAREPEHKKGMDEMQITGAASSYARKYALCGLFAIDDNKDADSMDNRAPEASKPEPVDRTIEHDEPEEGPNVTRKLKSRLVQICQKQGASPDMMRDWILVSFNKPFDDMTASEQAKCVATAEREFSVQKAQVS